MNINVVTLSLEYDDLLNKTIESVCLWAKTNPEINFIHHVVVPENKKIHIQYNATNYQLFFLVDKKEGIYSAFNMGLLNAICPGYIIFISAGDTIRNEVKLKKSQLNYDLISFGVNLVSIKKQTVFFAKYSAIYRKGIPHPGLLTDVDKLKNINGFSTKFGTASDFHATTKLLKNGNTLFISNEVLVNFQLGGASSKLNSLIGYYKVLCDLKFNSLTILALCSYKLLSVIKYKWFK